MKQRIQKWTSLGVGLVMVGCSTSPFKPGVPVEFEGGPLARKYRQEGVVVERNNLIENLRSVPASADKASTARTWQIVAAVPASVGGFAIGWYAFANDVDSNTRTTGILVGVGLAAIGIGLGIHAENILGDAVEDYNESLKSTKKPSKSGTLAPTLLYTGAGTDPWVPGVAATVRLD